MPGKKPCKEELLENIEPGMRLIKDFFKRIYAYEILWPGFSEVALSKLEEAGCSKARRYYDDWVQCYEAERNEKESLFL